MPALELSDIVDWDAVDDELARVPTQFKDPRFDSLRHVLNILGPVDANLRLEEVWYIILAAQAVLSERLIASCAAV